MTHCDEHSQVTPKRSRKGKGEWYPYYAGYSTDFVSTTLAGLKIGPNHIVLDPWHGVGTTGAAVAQTGAAFIGIDLNPAANIIASGRFATDSPEEFVFLDGSKDKRSDDPLCRWFSVEASSWIRAQLSHSPAGSLADLTISDRAALGLRFASIALSLKAMLKSLETTNPTWIRLTGRSSLDVSLTSLKELISLNYRLLRKQTLTPPSSRFELHTSSSKALPIEDSVIDAVVTSPPYCTRLDYAVATQVELALAGVDPQSDSFRLLREELIGAPVISGDYREIEFFWGRRCAQLLHAISIHTTHAASGYYLKTVLQYFSDLGQSILELDRVCRPQATVTLVLQSSWFKDVYIDLSKIVEEMCENLGWTKLSQVDFPVARTLADINPRSRSYRNKRGAVESALRFALPARKHKRKNKKEIHT